MDSCNWLLLYLPVSRDVPICVPFPGMVEGPESGPWEHYSGSWRGWTMRLWSHLLPCSSLQTFLSSSPGKNLRKIESVWVSETLVRTIQINVWAIKMSMNLWNLDIHEHLRQTGYTKRWRGLLIRTHSQLGDVEVSSKSDCLLNYDSENINLMEVGSKRYKNPILWSSILISSHKNTLENVKAAQPDTC